MPVVPKLISITSRSVGCLEGNFRRITLTLWSTTGKNHDTSRERSPTFHNSIGLLLFPSTQVLWFTILTDLILAHSQLIDERVTSFWILPPVETVQFRGDHVEFLIRVEELRQVGRVRPLQAQNKIKGLFIE